MQKQLLHLRVDALVLLLGHEPPLEVDGLRAGDDLRKAGQSHADVLQALEAVEALGADEGGGNVRGRLRRLVHYRGLEERLLGDGCIAIIICRETITSTDSIDVRNTTTLLII